MPGICLAASCLLDESSEEMVRWPPTELKMAKDLAEQG